MWAKLVVGTVALQVVFLRDKVYMWSIFHTKKSNNEVRVMFRVLLIRLAAVSEIEQSTNENKQKRMSAERCVRVHEGRTLPL